MSTYKYSAIAIFANHSIEFSKDDLMSLRALILAKKAANLGKSSRTLTTTWTQMSDTSSKYILFLIENVMLIVDFKQKHLRLGDRTKRKNAMCGGGRSFPTLVTRLKRRTRHFSSKSTPPETECG
jgi:hypothetical protein